MPDPLNNPLLIGGPLDGLRLPPTTTALSIYMISIHYDEPDQAFKPSDIYHRYDLHDRLRYLHAEVGSRLRPSKEPQVMTWVNLYWDGLPFAIASGIGI